MATRSRSKKRGTMKPDRLVQIRTARGLTQQELSHKSGVSVAMIQRYEYGKSDPTMKAAIALAKALDCSLDWLAGLSDDLQGRIMEKDLPPNLRRLLAAYRGTKEPFQKLHDILAALAADDEFTPKGGE